MFYESKQQYSVHVAGKLAVVQDLNDYIIADSDNVLLICKRRMNSKSASLLKTQVFFLMENTIDSFKFSNYDTAFLIFTNPESSIIGLFIMIRKKKP
jgi:hypothetical protein